MKTTLFRRFGATALAAAILFPVAGIGTAASATAAETNQTCCTQSLAPIDAAIYNAGLQRSGNYYSTNWVPFAKLTNGKTFVGDDIDGVYTRTWIPWTGATVLVAPESHTIVSSTPAAGAVHVKGAILTKFLGSGGEDLLGRPSANEVAGRAGSHDTALATSSQIFTKTTSTGAKSNSEIIWTKQYGAKLIKGAIRTKYEEMGGKRLNGAPTTDEHKVTVNGKVYSQQKFERTTIRWSSSTGAFPVR